MSDPNTAATDAAQWTSEQKALWERLREHRFDEPGSDEFALRVAKDARLHLDDAQAAIEEYRRFCFLAVAAGHPVTPSQRVDQVWHTHITDTRGYQAFCQQVLKQPLHHVPSRGGVAEDRRHEAQYADTLDSYRRYFGPLPERIWPDARIAQKVRALNLGSEREPSNSLRWLVRTGSITAIAYILLASYCERLNPLHWTGGAFLLWYLTLMFASLRLSGWLLRHGRNHGDRAKRKAEPWELAYLAGGAMRVADAVVAELLARDLVVLEFDRKDLNDARNNDQVWLRPQPQIPAQMEALPPILREAMDTIVASRKNLSHILGLLRQRYEGMDEELQRAGLANTAEQRFKAKLWSLVPPVAVIVLGVSKIVIGLQGDHPVAFLVVLTVLMLLITLVRMAIPVDAISHAGEWELYRARRRANESPGDALTYVALIGPAALMGTPLDGYNLVREPAGHGGVGGGDGGGGGGDGGGGDGGGGGCGGGCGGCGGS
jgi:uncharacterized protein (TIGR04222 family)